MRFPDEGITARQAAPSKPANHRFEDEPYRATVEGCGVVLDSPL